MATGFVFFFSIGFQLTLVAIPMYDSSKRLVEIESQATAIEVFENCVIVYATFVLDKKI